MKRQELDQLRQKSKAELVKDLTSTRRELVDGRLKRAQGTVANVRAVRALSRKIAQLETLVRQKDA